MPWVQRRAALLCRGSIRAFGLEVQKADLLLAGLLGAAFAVGNVALASTFSEPLGEKILANKWFQADTVRTLGDMFRWDGNHYRTKVHPLFVLLTYPVGWLLRRLLGQSEFATAVMMNSVWGALWLSSIYTILRLMDLRRIDAVLAALVAAFIGSSVFWFPVPETYALGSLSVVLPFLAVSVHRIRALPLPALVAVGTFSMAVTVTNWMSGLLAAVTTRPWRKAIVAAGSMAAVATGLWIVQKLTFPNIGGFFLKDQGYEAQYFLLPQTGGPLQILTVFLLHAIVVPSIAVWDGMLSIQLSPVFGHGWLHDVTVIVWAFALVSGAAAAIARRARAPRFSFMLVAFVAGQLCLHLVYGDEMFLYSPHLSFALVLVAAHGLVLAKTRWVSRTVFIALVLLLPSNNLARFAEASGYSLPYPVGAMHVPIGVPNTADDLKTFVEPSGRFSPGVGSFGVAFELRGADGAIIETETRALGLEDGLLLPQIRRAGAGWELGLRYAQANLPMAAPTQVLAVEATIHNAKTTAREVDFVLRLTGAGPAGGSLRDLRQLPEGDGVSVRGIAALLSRPAPTAIGIHATPTEEGELHFRLALGPGGETVVRFLAPALLGQPPMPHQWRPAAKGPTFVDVAPSPLESEVLAVRTSAEDLRSVDFDEVFARARQNFTHLTRGLKVRLPDARWQRALRAIPGHIAMAFNSDAPDVSVLNYNPYTRDAASMIHVLQRVGEFDLAGGGIDSLLRNPFQGRPFPEADAPGQVLWTMEQQWLLARDEAWVRDRVDAIEKLASLIRYYRTTPGPHYVGSTDFAFGSDLNPEDRQELLPGRCDGNHPEYTFAFDIAGLRAAAVLKAVAGKDSQADTELANQLLTAYKNEFGARLDQGYGPYVLLWPTRLFELDSPQAAVFSAGRASGVKGWHYFTLAKAHQGLFAGSSGVTSTIEAYLAHEYVRSWALLDEGGPSASGGWAQLQTDWPVHVAMPHGWSIAELWHLLRDGLVFEDRADLVLLGGVPASWFEQSFDVDVITEFGPAGYSYKAGKGEGTLTLRGSPPGGFTVRVPKGFSAWSQAGVKLSNLPTGERVVVIKRDSDRPP